MSNFTYDHDGTVTGFPYHDGHLDGLLITEREEVVLALRSIDGEHRLLKLSGVQYLDVDEFRQGNIVIDIYVLSKELLSRHEEFSKLVAAKLFVTAEQIRNDSIVFVLQSAYGAEIVAVCSDVNVGPGRLVATDVL